MIKLINLLKEITEGKQVGDIYHFTDTDTLALMIKEKGGIVLDSSYSSFAADKYYSFTRNPNLGTLSEEKQKLNNTLREPKEKDTFLIRE